MSKPLRWGIIGCGKISQDFVLAILNHGKHSHTVVAVATSNSADRAQDFAQRLGLHDEAKAYGSYEALLDDANVDVVYIGNLNDAHCPTTLMALDKGKNVLCEKALAVNTREVKEMFAKAKEKNLFLMEAFWARFFPAWQYIGKLTHSKELGEVRVAHANFGVLLENNRRHAQTGETPLLDIGLYAVGFALHAFGSKKPRAIHVVGHKNSEGSDVWANITLEYGDDSHAICYYHSNVCLPNSAYVSFEKGQIQISEFFWCPTQVLKFNFPLVAGQSKPEVLDFPLNAAKSTQARAAPDSKTLADFNYNNSAGLCYEADHVYECLQQGKKESNVMSSSESIMFAEILEEIRHKLGVVFKQDKHQ